MELFNFLIIFDLLAEPNRNVEDKEKDDIAPGMQLLPSHDVTDGEIIQDCYCIRLKK